MVARRTDINERRLLLAGDRGVARRLRARARRTRRGIARGARRAHDQPARRGVAPARSPRGGNGMNDGHDSDARALAAQVDAWEKGEVASFLARAPERQPEFRTQGGLPLQAGVHPAGRGRHAVRRHRPPWPVSVHARALPDDVSRAAVDDAPDRGIRHRRGHERTVQVSDRTGADRIVDRLRHADADGLRQRPSALRGRGGPRGRRRSTRSPTWSICSTASTSSASRCR